MRSTKMEFLDIDLGANIRLLGLSYELWYVRDYHGIFRGIDSFRGFKLIQVQVRYTVFTHTVQY